MLPRWSNNHKKCKLCGTTERPHYGKGRCNRCYWREASYKRKIKESTRPRNKTCKICKEPTATLWLERCQTCYKRLNSRNTHLQDGRWSEYSKSCVDCKTTEKPHHAKGRCGTCRSRVSRAFKKVKPSTKIEITVADVKVRADVMHCGICESLIEKNQQLLVREGVDYHRLCWFA